MTGDISTTSTPGTSSPHAQRHESLYRGLSRTPRSQGLCSSETLIDASKVLAPSPRTTPSSSPRPPDLSSQLQPVCRATTASAKHSASHYLLQQGSMCPFERGGNGDARILSYSLSYRAKSRSGSSAASLQTSDLNQGALLFLPTPTLQGHVRREPPPQASAGRWHVSAPSPVEGSRLRGVGIVSGEETGSSRTASQTSEALPSPLLAPWTSVLWGPLVAQAGLSLQGGWHLLGRWLCSGPGFLCRI